MKKLLKKLLTVLLTGKKPASRSFTGHTRRFGGGNNDVLQKKSRHNRRNLAGQHSRCAR
ncbi:unknown [Acidiphilium sp. CAG:727]|nr:unknown [Acidiphilium sp. CAG:727]